MIGWLFEFFLKRDAWVLKTENQNEIHKLLESSLANKQFTFKFKNDCKYILEDVCKLNRITKTLPSPRKQDAQVEQFTVIILEIQTELATRAVSIYENAVIEFRGNKIIITQTIDPLQNPTGSKITLVWR